MTSQTATTYKIVNDEHPLELFVRKWSVENPKAVVALCHGYAEHSGRYEHVARAFNASGCEVHALDLRGHGNSPDDIVGQRANVRQLDHFVSDVETLLVHVKNLHPSVPVVLFGHSLGGLLAATYLIQKKLEHANSKVDVLLLSSPFLAGDKLPPFWLEPILTRLGNAFPTISTGSKVDAVYISKQPEEVAAYVNDPLNYHGAVKLGMAAIMLQAQAIVAKHAQQLDLPVYGIHGDADAIANISGTERFFAALQSEQKEWHSFAGGYHELLNDVEAADALLQFNVWLEPHINNS